VTREPQLGRAVGVPQQIGLAAGMGAAARAVNGCGAPQLATAARVSLLGAGGKRAAAWVLQQQVQFGECAKRGRGTIR
jgi:hypothetical protein